MTDGNRCIHGYELACRACLAAGNWPPKRRPVAPKPCLIWWSPRTQLWHGTAFGFQTNGHTVASVYANLEAMVSQYGKYGGRIPTRYDLMFDEDKRHGL